MNCNGCGRSCESDENFCSGCGQALGVKCERCENICKRGALFCPACGAKLLVEESAIGADTNPVISRSTIPVVTKPKELEDVRKHVTVLFADIKSSTKLIEDLDPEEAKNVLSPVLEVMIDAVYSYDGMIIHTAGDGVVAVFGAPQALEDHALRACLAALMMIAKAKKINDKINLRVGLDSGEVLLEVVGSAAHQEFGMHQEYDIKGKVVHLAARMEQTTTPGSIQLTRNTYALSQDMIEVIPLDAIEVKGFSAPVDIFKLIGIKEKKSLLRIKSSFISLPFVGREQEMKQLAHLLKLAKSGQGQAVGLVAEAGQGKSRLLYEFTLSSLAKTCDVFMSQCNSYLRNTPLFPILQLMRTILRIAKEDTPAEVIASVTNQLEKLNLSQYLNPLLSLLTIPTQDENWNTLDASLKRKYRFEAVSEFLLQSSKKKPLIVLIEDWYWVDNETELFIDTLIANMSKSPIMLITTFRSIAQDHQPKTPNYTQMALRPLTEDGQKIIMDTLLGMNPSLTNIKEKLSTKCHGNPFFLEEILKTLISDEVLMGSPQHYYFNTKLSIDKVQLPESIYSVLQARIDILSQKQKKILRTASVIGEHFDYSLLAQLVEMDSNELRHDLNELLKMEYIYETRIYPEPEFTFKHALIQEVAYSTMLKSLRLPLHSKILNILEVSPPLENEATQLQLQATHAYAAEAWEKALYYCGKSADNVFSMFANKLAVDLYEKTLVIADHIPRKKEDNPTFFQIHAKLCTLYHRLGQLEIEKLHIEKAITLALEMNEPHFKALAYALNSIYCIAKGDTDDALKYDTKVNDLLASLKDLDTILSIKCSQLVLHFFMGNFQTVYRKGNEIIADVPDKDYLTKHSFPPYFFATVCLWRSHAYTGDYTPGTEEINALVSTDATQRPGVGLCVNMAMSYMLYNQNHFDEAIEYLLKALECTDAGEMVNYIPQLLATTGCSYLHLNDVEKGKKYIDEAIELVQVTNSNIVKMAALVDICEGLLLLKDDERGLKFVKEALVYADKLHLRGIKVSLLRISAEFDLYVGDKNYVAIENKLNEALKLATQLGMVSHIDHCHSILATLHKISGSG